MIIVRPCITPPLSPGYEVIVVITNKKEAGTQHGLWFSVEGSAGSTDKMEVENKMGRFFKVRSWDWVMLYRLVVTIETLEV